MLCSLHIFCTGSKTKTIINRVDYATTLARIKLDKAKLKKEYNEAQNKTQVIEKVRNYLIANLCDSIFPYWYNTPWDFNGTTSEPGKGKIACGYFVSHTLSDLGFNVPRIKFAQSASEPVIKKLAEKKLWWFSNLTVDTIKTKFIKMGDGIYLAGLDNHVGFIVVKNDSVNFVHASYYQPEIGVMSQDISTNNPFKNSKYRVIGKLFTDEMVRKWLTDWKYTL